MHSNPRYNILWRVYFILSIVRVYAELMLSLWCESVAPPNQRNARNKFSTRQHGTEKERNRLSAEKSPEQWNVRSIPRHLPEWQAH